MKNCPNCGKQVPDDAKFCMDCGYSFGSSQNGLSGILSNGKIFLVIIVVVVILGLIVIGLTGNGGNDNSQNDANGENHAVDLTITEVSGWNYSYDGKKSYSLSTSALFNHVPDDQKGYNIKTSYFDANGTQIGYETEKLENIYYDSDYALSFGYYTTYKLPDPDHVTVDIIKGGKVVDSYTEQIDKSKIEYLN